MENQNKTIEEKENDFAIGFLVWVENLHYEKYQEKLQLFFNNDYSKLIKSYRDENEVGLQGSNLQPSK